jgi:DNA-binding NarL/FixJ family response regulator
MKILLIEDHPLKRSHIIDFISSQFEDVEIVVKNSYITGLKELIKNNKDYDFLFLDISMPNYDISSEDSGGDWMPLAGKSILKQLYFRNIPIKTIVITMHGNFEDGLKMSDLDALLKKEFKSNYQGYVYYSQVNEDWKSKLVQILQEIND